MTDKDFEKIFIDQLDSCASMLLRKARLYAHGQDRLSNFKKAGALSGCTPAYAAWGMLVKHIVALSDYLVALENKKIYPYVEWNEKVTDIINYLILMKATLVEEHFADVIHGYGQRDGRPNTGSSGLDEHGTEEAKIQESVSGGCKEESDKGICVLEELDPTGGDGDKVTE